MHFDPILGARIPEDHGVSPISYDLIKCAKYIPVKGVEKRTLDVRSYPKHIDRPLFWFAIDSKTDRIYTDSPVFNICQQDVLNSKKASTYA